MLDKSKILEESLKYLQKKTNFKLIKFFEWLYFTDIYKECGMPYKLKVIKIYNLNNFLCEKRGGINYQIPIGRTIVGIIWDKYRIYYLVKRILHI